MLQFSLRAATALCGLVLVISTLSSGAATSSGIVSAQSSSFTCTEVIGFSQTEQWYDGGFIGSIPNPGNWQLRWFSGGSVDQWADHSGGFTGWDSQYLVSHCSNNSGSPDRVVFEVSGQFSNDPNWWANQTALVVDNIRHKYANEHQISLIPVVGGPGGQQCFDSSGNVVRATYNFPYINQGISMDLGAEVIAGSQPTVRACSDYADNVGHLIPAGAQAAGDSIAQFYASGTQSGSSTSTPTPASAATNTRTPTPLPTSTPAALPNGASRVGFDDLSNPNRPLTGQYPSGVIDWGSGPWYLSGPYGQFSSQSISFNGAGPTSASFTFVSPRRPVQVDVYNGGSASSLVTLSCNGTLMNQVSLPAGQLTTLPSGMNGTCTTVTLGSSNGWNTNFDSLIIDNGAPPTATPVPTNTATATATPTRPASSGTATPTPGAGTSSVVGFDDLPSPNRTLSGTYAGMDWGSGAWWLSGPYAQFTSNSVSFNGPSQRSAVINMPTPLRLIQLDADNGGTASSTVSLTCAGQPTVQAVVAPGQVMTLRTGWTATCSSLTLSSANGWDTNFDNLVISGSGGGGGSATATPTPQATSTPTRTPTPRTVTFDDLSNPNRALTGQYPNGIIDWGSSGWYLSGPYGSFNTNSVSFNGAGPTSAVFTILSGTLTSIDAHNGGTTTTSITVSCGSQPTARVQLAPNQTATLATGWTAPCANVTFTSSNGWNTNFDNLRLQ